MVSCWICWPMAWLIDVRGWLIAKHRIFVPVPVYWPVRYRYLIDRVRVARYFNSVPYCHCVVCVFSCLFITLLQLKDLSTGLEIHCTNCWTSQSPPRIRRLRRNTVAWRSNITRTRTRATQRPRRCSRELTRKSIYTVLSYFCFALLQKVFEIFLKKEK